MYLYYITINTKYSYMCICAYACVRICVYVCVCLLVCMCIIYNVRRTVLDINTLDRFEPYHASIPCL